MSRQADSTPLADDDALHRLEDKRERLLDAADRVVQRSGSAASMNLIAAEAGITRGAVSQWTTKLERLAQRMEGIEVSEGETWPAEAAASARAAASWRSPTVRTAWSTASSARQKSISARRQPLDKILQDMG